MIGVVRGQLTVQERVRGGWRCLCTCGTEVVLGTAELTDGAVRSCGCRRRAILARGAERRAAGIPDDPTRPRRVVLGPRSRCIPEAQAMDLEPLTQDDLFALGSRPRTRADCASTPRPCPWVGCRHHLYLDVNPETGSLKLNFPDREPWELERSCALDVADSGAVTLDVLGRLLNVTRERARQIEVHVTEELGAKLREA